VALFEVFEKGSTLQKIMKTGDDFISKNHIFILKLTSNQNTGNS
jgi:hypothetical protein